MSVAKEVKLDKDNYGLAELFHFLAHGPLGVSQTAFLVHSIIAASNDSTVHHLQPSLCYSRMQVVIRCWAFYFCALVLS